MPVSAETSTDGRKSSLTPRDRTRPSTSSDRERRQTLGAVGRVASRVRNSGINRLQAAFAAQRPSASTTDEDVDASPWGVGKAVVLDPQPLPGNHHALPKSSSASSRIFSSPSTNPPVETESVSPGSSATSIQNSTRSSKRNSRTPTSPKVLTYSSSTHGKLHPDSAIDPSSPLSAGSSGTSSASANLTPLLMEDRARPRSPSVSISNALTSHGATLVPAQGSIFSTMIFIPPSRTTSNLETEVAKQKLIPIPASSDVVKKSSKVAFRASVDVSPQKKNAPCVNDSMSPSKKLSDAKPGDAKSSDARPSDAKSSDAKPSDAHAKPGSAAKPGLASAATSSPLSSVGQEKSLFRTLLNRSKLNKGLTNNRAHFSPDRRKTSQGIARSVSTAMSDHATSLIDSTNDTNDNADQDQPRIMSKSMELRKMRTKRSKEREDNRPRPFSAWFSSKRPTATNNQVSPNTSKTNRGKMTSQSRINGRRATTNNSSSPVQKLMNEPSETSHRSPGKEDVSTLNFADGEFYDSEEDEEHAGDDDIAVPSLAKDDFVAYQTSQKRKVQKVRVSLMRM